MDEKIDLFDTLVKFLAVKPLKLDKFDLKEAEGIIKEDRQSSITFIGEHGYFEEMIDRMVDEIIESREKVGTVYIYVKGPNTVAKVRKKIYELSFHVDKIIIFGDQSEWPQMSQNIYFTGSEDIFTDNHQRFFVYQGSTFSVALVARHGQKEEGRIESALTTSHDAVSLLSLTISKRIPPLHL